MLTPANLQLLKKCIQHWRNSFASFLSKVVTKESDSGDKLLLLNHYASPTVNEYFSDCTTYEEAIQNLNSISIRKKNEILARYELTSRKQGGGESLEQFFRALK
ncbi:unnamed protein product [Lepeophtheirus salmonis]|uniref:(salmon louse) hypothetical protein n=1 Tax=Lepeophtheirus salmonis TaxID=72036 RepID=A0A7R8HAS3_LEPSM|nr:unnamed protein product [Lepeophtheirus salmonis]CAF2971096.1 unnamed protein product [Lepeophtheirus salmonis]